MWSRSAKVAGAEVISGYFRADGTRIYSVKPIEDYVFLREPTNPSCAYQIVGMIAGEKQPDARFWRWIAPVLPSRIYGGGDEPPNLKVDFLVFGYRPRALLKHFSER